MTWRRPKSSCAGPFVWIRSSAYVTRLGTCLLRLGKPKEVEIVIADHLKGVFGAHRAQSTLDVAYMYLWADRYAEAADRSEQATKLFTEFYKTQGGVPETQKKLRWSHISYARSPSTGWTAARRR